MMAINHCVAAAMVWCEQSRARSAASISAVKPGRCAASQRDGGSAARAVNMASRTGSCSFSRARQKSRMAGRLEASYRPAPTTAATACARSSPSGCDRKGWARASASWNGRQDR